MQLCTYRPLHIRWKNGHASCPVLEQFAVYAKFFDSRKCGPTHKLSDCPRDAIQYFSIQVYETLARWWNIICMHGVCLRLRDVVFGHQ